MGTKRDPKEIREHYEIERELAGRLRNAPPAERHRLYAAIYEELFDRVPHHPQIARKASPEETARSVGRQMAFLRRFLSREATFLELGAGSCALSLEVARYVKTVYALDVSAAITSRRSIPDNVRLIISDGCSIPVPEGSVDIAFSYQLMEHLHPDDALEQLGNVYRALAPGGFYICITPNRLNGPHDISKHFDIVSTGFHLREYSIKELTGLFAKVGFSRIKPMIGGRGAYSTFPLVPLVLLEKLLDRLPYRARFILAASAPVRLFLGIRVVGYK